MFTLAYYGRGGFTINPETIPVYLRKWFHKRVLAQVEKDMKDRVEGKIVP